MSIFTHKKQSRSYQTYPIEVERFNLKNKQNIPSVDIEALMWLPHLNDVSD